MFIGQGKLTSPALNKHSKTCAIMKLFIRRYCVPCLMKSTTQPSPPCYKQLQTLRLITRKSWRPWIMKKARSAMVMLIKEDQTAG